MTDDNEVIMSHGTVRYRRDGAIATVTLDRPTTLNAMNDDLMLDLNEALGRAADDTAVRALVLTGAGRGFCSGMDLKAFARGEDIGPLDKFIKAGCEKPLIGAIEGFALAGGCEIALTCDLLVAAAGAKIGIREVKVGLFAGAGGLFRLPSRVGYAKAMEMAITGDPITAEEAQAAGMVSQVTEPGKALDAAIALAERVAENAPLAVAASKKLVRAAAQGYNEEELWEMQKPLAKVVFKSNDAKEGPKAFAEKRKPNWSGT